MIASETSGVLYEIVPQVAYPTDYDTVVAQAKEEIRQGARPALRSPVVRASDFDVIYVGTPNWWGTMAPPVATFLEELAKDGALKGKTVVPFLTHGSGGKQRVCADIQTLSTQATVRDCFAATGNTAALNDVKSWIAQ